MGTPVHHARQGMGERDAGGGAAAEEHYQGIERVSWKQSSPRN